MHPCILCSILCINRRIDLRRCFVLYTNIALLPYGACSFLVIRPTTAEHSLHQSPDRLRRCCVLYTNIVLLSYGACLLLVIRLTTAGRFSPMLCVIHQHRIAFFWCLFVVGHKTNNGGDFRRCCVLYTNIVLLSFGACSSLVIRSTTADRYSPLLCVIHQHRIASLWCMFVVGHKTNNGVLIPVLFI